MRLAEGVSAPTLRAFGTPSSTVNTWTGAGDHLSWSNAGNWSLNHVPTISELVSIPDLVNTGYISLIGSYSVKSLISAELFSLSGAGTSFLLTNGGAFNAGLTPA